MTNRKTAYGVLVGACGAALALAAAPAPAKNPDKMMPAAGVKLMASLSGAEEVGGGDHDGYGTFTARLNPGLGKMCYKFHVDHTDDPIAEHIHRGVAGENGPVVVTFDTFTDNEGSGCVDVPTELAHEIIANPSGFYVNVHDSDFPAGAVRGQLMD